MKMLSLFLAILCVITLTGCASNTPPSFATAEPPASTAEASPTPPEATATPSPAPTATEALAQSLDTSALPAVNIRVGSRDFTATLRDNDSARAIVQAMPFTLQMDDFSSQEKVTSLSIALPSAQAITPSTINAGDIYLWSGNNLVLFYTTFPNSYSYVPVGYVNDVTGLRDALGRGTVEVTFSVE